MDTLYQAVRRADFSALTELLPQIEGALSAGHVRLDATALRRLQAKAQRNAELLLAAGRGVRAASQRLQEILSGSRGLATYDGKGQRAEPGAVPTVGRRV